MAAIYYISEEEHGLSNYLNSGGEPCVGIGLNSLEHGGEPGEYGAIQSLSADSLWGINLQATRYKSPSWEP